MEKILVDNPSEKITARWDGERFSLSHLYTFKCVTKLHTIILSPKEMLELIEFARKLVIDPWVTRVKKIIEEN